MKNLIAGRELDALIAEKVMGWEIGVRGGLANISPQGSKWSRHKDPLEGIPEYSTDIAAAWQVVEQLRVEYRFSLDDRNPWAAQFSKRETTCDYYDNGYGHAETAPHAICLAALDAWRRK